MLLEALSFKLAIYFNTSITFYDVWTRSLFKETIPDVDG